MMFATNCTWQEVIVVAFDDAAAADDDGNDGALSKAHIQHF